MSRQTCTGIGGRGCPCLFHTENRIYQREYAARRRTRRLDAKRMSARTCPKRYGRWGVCGGVLRSDVVEGRVVVTCDACDRFDRGICRECPRPVYGTARKARRCEAHAALAQLTSQRKHDANHKAKRRLSSRRNYQQNDARRVQKNEYKKAWRKANPEKVKAQKRREALRQSPRTLEYHKAYRAVHRVKRANVERARERGVVALRTCITPRCSIVVTGRKKKCTRCRERERAAATSALAPHAGRGRRTDLERVA